MYMYVVEYRTPEIYEAKFMQMGMLCNISILWVRFSYRDVYMQASSWTIDRQQNCNIWTPQKFPLYSIILLKTLHMYMYMCNVFNMYNAM